MRGPIAAIGAGVLGVGLTVALVQKEAYTGLLVALIGLLILALLLQRKYTGAEIRAVIGDVVNTGKAITVHVFLTNVGTSQNVGIRNWALECRPRSYPRFTSARLPWSYGYLPEYTLFIEEDQNDSDFYRFVQDCRVSPIDERGREGVLKFRVRSNLLEKPIKSVVLTFIDSRGRRHRAARRMECR